MPQGIENKILSRIYGRGREWAFTKTDFVAEFDEANIYQALSSLTKAEGSVVFAEGATVILAIAGC